MSSLRGDDDLDSILNAMGRGVYGHEESKSRKDKQVGKPENNAKNPSQQELRPSINKIRAKENEIGDAIWRPGVLPSQGEPKM